MITAEVRNTVRGGRRMTKEELAAFLKGAAYATVSFVNDEGWPDMRPVNIAMWNGRFYFHANKVRGEKLKYLDGKNRVVLSIMEPSDRVGADHVCVHKSALIYGRVERIDGIAAYEDEIVGGMTALCLSGGTPWKAAPERRQRILTGCAVFRVTPEYTVGKLSCFLSTKPSE